MDWIETGTNEFLDNVLRALALLFSFCGHVGIRRKVDYARY
jgi:hypothetical protein